MDSPDLSAKYQKLATEYSKLRAQNQVLKKAVLEEQGRNSSILDQLKSKDQLFRKAELENDSLNFRNQQLTKRLALLQDDLDSTKSKIEENAKLHSQISDTEAAYQTRITELESRLENMQKKSDLYKMEIKSSQQKSAKEYKELECEKMHLDVVLQDKVSEIKLAQEEIESLKKFSSMQHGNNLGEERNESLDCINSLPLSSPDSFRTVKSHKFTSSEIILGYQPLVIELCKVFPAFFKTFEKYAEHLCEDSSVDSVKIESLQSAHLCWNSLNASYDVLLDNVTKERYVETETLPGLASFAQAVGICSSSLRKSLPVLLQIFGGVEAGSNWKASISRLVTCWGALTPFLTTLANQNVVASWKQIFDTQTGKSSASSSVLKCLQSLATITEQISVKFKSDVLPSLESDDEKHSSPDSSSPKSSQRHYLTPTSNRHSSLEENSGPVTKSCLSTSVSLPTLADQKTTLAKQLALANSRLEQLEAERENLKLEHQLLQHRHYKEIKRASQLELELEKLQKLAGNKLLNDSTDSANISGDYAVSISIIGEVSGLDNVASEREQEIRNHFTNRCSRLYMQITEVISQAQLYQNECENIMKRLAYSEEQRTSLEEEVNLLKSELDDLKENLQITSRNYEEQISTMSEHLADLNEKLAKRGELIDELKFELRSKKGKK